MGRLVILTGPSCVGKGPLHDALNRHYPRLARRLHKLVLYNSRAPRPGERDGRDYYFRPRHEIEALRDREHFILMDVRGDLQALDVASLREILAGPGDAFFEGNPFVPVSLLDRPALSGIASLSVFLSPLSREEILFLRHPDRGVDLPALVADVQRRKLLLRMQKQKGRLSLGDLENVERRCNSAYREMQLAWRFDHVLPNHDGEGHDHWDAFYYPVGDAYRVLQAFVALLEGGTTDYAERWEPDLLPQAGP
ncbi:MAG: hypothetical protein JXA37_09760 [Chloroflexia bacterium]|nr:hypothetical protein [Chloroflexia bacterium]